MAEQVNILQLNSGVPFTDPTSGYLYIVIGGIDGFISTDNLLKYMLGKENIRAHGSVAVTEGSNDIVFEVDGVPTALASADYSIILFENSGIGNEITAQDEEGFTINAANDGLLNYIVILNT